jgi:hypothetical protein
VIFPDSIPNKATALAGLCPPKVDEKSPLQRFCLSFIVVPTQRLQRGEKVVCFSYSPVMG